MKPLIGVIGGSGLYEMDGLVNTHWKRVQSPFGEPSDELMFGEMNGTPMVFQARHGRGAPDTAFPRSTTAPTSMCSNVPALRT